MVALLRQSGHTASFVKGQIDLTAAQVEAFFGVNVDNVCAVSKLLANGQIPIIAIYGTSASSCTAGNPPVPLHSAVINHLWVKVDIGGTEYHFDPGFKPHTRKTGIDLVSASGYDANAYLSEAQSGATITTDYVQNINRTNIRNRLDTYATNLANTLRANQPTATLDDAIGGKRTYTRNQAGDITTQAWNNDLYQWSGAANGTTNYANNKQDQYTSVGGAAYSYDGNGNLTGDGVWTYGYDLDNRLKSANKSGYTASLDYDAEGRLRKTTLGGTATELLYDGVDLVAEYDGAGALLRKYAHGPGINEPLAVIEGSAKTWLYADHQGSVVGQANASGTNIAIYSYGPFGEPNATTGVRFRYTGQQYLKRTWAVLLQGAVLFADAGTVLADRSGGDAR